MQLIELPRSHGLQAGGLSALAGVIGHVGNPHFGQQALADLNRWMPLAWWSVYTLYQDAPPSLHAHGSIQAFPDGTAASWRVYRDSLYRRDATFAVARDRVAPGTTAMVHWNASEIPIEHRSAIYSAHGLQERLSIVTPSERHGLLAINFYRHEHQPVFCADAIDAVADMAPPLLACVQRHVTLNASLPAQSDALEGLTARERDVCQRLLKGWTQDGIAADLGLTAPTVKTYRDRAFNKLGIRYRHELFARVAAAPQKR